MPAQSSPRFPRGFGGGFGSGFGPLLSGGHSDQNMRVSDAERQAVADRLAEHYGDGRLNQAEFDERVSQAMNAKTRADLRGLFDDLPEPGMPGVMLPGAGAPAGQPSLSPLSLRGRRHGFGRRLASFALIAVITAAAAETVVRVTVPWLWLGFLAVVMLVANERAGRPRGDHSRDDRDLD
jgi:hypothetical protein